MLSAIVAVDENWAIGKDNNLLFHIKADMEYFRARTTNKIVACGYNTLISFPRQRTLKNRSTIVIAPENVERTDCFVMHDFSRFRNLLLELSKTQDVYVIGGAMLYTSLIDDYDVVRVTKVFSDGQGTVFFPNLDNLKNYRLDYIGDLQEENNLNFRFLTYNRLAADN